MADERLAAIVRDLEGGAAVPHRLVLDVGGCGIELRTNSAELNEQLRDYFRHFVTADAAVEIRITVLEAPEPDFGLDYTEWPRDPGKQGRKDAFADIGEGRVVRKVRTGMHFVLLPGRSIAVGPCIRNANQVINLVNSQYMAWRMAGGALLCHSAAVARGERGIALSGVSGAGKSTLALELLSAGLAFVSNDRLLVKRTGDTVEMAGVPKMPRINPGTILGNRDLWPLIDEARRELLAAMPKGELWQLEEKYDADIERLYGPDRITPNGRLVAFVVLTWSVENQGPAELRRGRVGDRPDLLPAIMKHPGPFILDPNWRARAPSQDPDLYLEHLGSVPLVEFTGGVDFAMARRTCLELLLPDGR